MINLLMSSKPNNALPVYHYKDNSGSPLNNSQIQAILNNPNTKIISAYDSSITFTPSSLPNGNTFLPASANRPPETAYRVANWYSATDELVYHSKNRR